ncbi:MAG TPA: flavodoxin domain-containing protein, partial [Chloroflexia bacterium]|nr:flavodoxin domain-containing protein [Chloroflexia bacterium]
MKILIAVASKHGSTREIAETIAAELRDAKHIVSVREADAVNEIARYDAVILGSAVYMGTWLDAARSFAAQHRAALAQRPLWLFSSGPLGANFPERPDDPDQLALPLDGVEIRDHRVFVGKLDRRNFSFGERLMAKV